MGRLFAPRVFLLALVLAVAGVLVGGLFPFLDSVGRFVGVFLAGFLLGVGRAGRHYVEAGVAGGLAAGIGFVLPDLGTLALAAGIDVVPVGTVTVAGVGVTSAALVAVAGHYFGRDLRAGLTREV